MERTNDHGDGSCFPARVVVNELKKCLDLLQELQLTVTGDGIIGEISACVRKALEELKSTAPVEGQTENVVGSLSQQLVTSPLSENSSRNSTIKTKKKTINRKRSHPYMTCTERRDGVEDEYTWRKYGQKQIYSSKHPRNYYRCTHKNTRGCKAIRQTQKSEEDESIYIITYIGRHTCNDNNHHHSSSSSSSNINTSCLISFGGQNSTSTTMTFQTKPADHQLASPLLPPPPPLTYVTKSEETMDYHQDPTDGLTSDCFTSLQELESLQITTTLNSDTGSEHGDAVSGFVKTEDDFGKYDYIGFWDQLSDYGFP